MAIWSVLKPKYLCSRRIFFLNSARRRWSTKNSKGHTGFHCPWKKISLEDWNSIKDSVVYISFYGFGGKSHQVKTAFVLQTHMLTAESEEFKLWENSPQFLLHLCKCAVHFEVSYQSLSTKCENWFCQISTKVTFDRVQKPELLQDGGCRPIWHRIKGLCDHNLMKLNTTEGQN